MPSRSAAETERRVPSSQPRPRDARGRAIDLEPLRPLLGRLYSTWHPVEVWLFGSRARGDARADSDWDLLIVLPDDAPPEAVEPRTAWNMRKACGVPAQIFSYRAQDFRDYRDTPNTIPYAATHEGVLLDEH